MEEGRSIDWGIDLSTKPGERYFVLFICTFLFNMKKKEEKNVSGSKKERNEHSGGGNWKHDR